MGGKITSKDEAYRGCGEEPGTCGSSESDVVIIIKAVGFLVLQEPTLPLEGQGLNHLGGPRLWG